MVALIDPGDSAVFTLDWSDTLAEGITLASVTHALPSPLEKLSESTQSPTSSVQIRGAIHGQTYLIEASAVLTPSGETLNRQFPLRCFNG